MTDLPPTTPPTDPIPYDSPAPKSDNGWMGIVSLICGIVSLPGNLCCCIIGWPAALAGIVFGVLGLKSSQSMMAKIGIGLSILGLLLYLVVLILQLVFNIGIPGARGPSIR